MSTFTFDLNHKGAIDRIDIQYECPTKFVVYGVFTDSSNGKNYRVNLFHNHNLTIDTVVYLNGRALPEKHRSDVRAAAIDAYCEAYNLRPVILLGRGATVYRTNKESSK